VSDSTESFEELTDWLPHEFYMQKAIDQALIAAELDEVPVGAVIVREGRGDARHHPSRRGRWQLAPRTMLSLRNS